MELNDDCCLTQQTTKRFQESCFLAAAWCFPQIENDSRPLFIRPF